jgi:hypothetical protein
LPSGTSSDAVSLYPVDFPLSEDVEDHVSLPNTQAKHHVDARNVIVAGFGMTETCAGAIIQPLVSEQHVVRSRTVASLGQCMPGIEMRILSDSDGGAVPYQPREAAPASAPADIFTDEGGSRREPKLPLMRMASVFDCEVQRCHQRQWCQACDGGCPGDSK